MDPPASKDIDVVGEHSTYKINLVGNTITWAALCTIEETCALRSGEGLDLPTKPSQTNEGSSFTMRPAACEKSGALQSLCSASSFMAQIHGLLLTAARSRPSMPASDSCCTAAFSNVLATNHLSDDQILLQTGLPSPSELLRIQRLRYLGSLLACNHLVD